MCSDYRLKKLAGDIVAAVAIFIGWRAKSGLVKIWHRSVVEIAVSAR